MRLLALLQPVTPVNIVKTFLNLTYRIEFLKIETGLLLR